jgi:hypothetical protein
MTPRHGLIVLCVLAFGAAAHAQPVNATARADATVHRTYLLGRSIDGRTITAVETGDPDTQHKTLVVGCTRRGSCLRARGRARHEKQRFAGRYHRATP